MQVETSSPESVRCLGCTSQVNELWPVLEDRMEGKEKPISITEKNITRNNSHYIKIYLSVMVKTLHLDREKIIGPTLGCSPSHNPSI